MSDPRVDSLLNDAMRLRLSRRSIMRRGAALGLSTAAVTQDSPITANCRALAVFVARSTRVADCRSSIDGFWRSF